MLYIDDVAIAPGRDLDSVNPAISRSINWLTLDTAKLIVKSRMEVIGSKLREVAREVVSPTRLHRRTEESLLNLL